ncbi:MAG: AAA domain-containing protein, partial [Blastochloris sp.]|nr:AAA domain-containing protein [Blastochloris sp.]
MTTLHHPTATFDTSLPFPALVAVEHAQQALLLLAVEPRLRGVVFAAAAGTGKSTLARGVRALLDPATPFVELPASIDIDNLLGGLDLEATLRTGQLTTQRGVLARAHNGLVYVDGVNLLADSVVNLLLGVLDAGEVHVERETASFRAPANFSLIGSYDPSEGPPRRHLLDRVGLMVTLPAATSLAVRERVSAANLRGDHAAWNEDADFLRGLIVTARDHLRRVQIDDDAVR